MQPRIVGSATVTMAVAGAVAVSEQLEFMARCGLVSHVTLQHSTPRLFDSVNHGNRARPASPPPVRCFFSRSSVFLPESGDQS
eukprot:873982-Pleurochrysis_carterae.AAC.1